MRHRLLGQLDRLRPALEQFEQLLEQCGIPPELCKEQGEAGEDQVFVSMIYTSEYAEIEYGITVEVYQDGGVPEQIAFFQIYLRDRKSSQTEPPGFRLEFSANWEDPEKWEAISLEEEGDWKLFSASFMDDLMIPLFGVEIMVVNPAVEAGIQSERAFEIAKAMIEYTLHGRLS